MANPTGDATSAPHLTSADASITSSSSQPTLQGATTSTDDKTKSTWQKFKDFIQTPKGMQVMCGVAVGVGALITGVTVIGGIAAASAATGGVALIAFIVAMIFVGALIGTALMMGGGAGLVLTAGAGNEKDKDKPADALEKNNMSVTTQEQFIKDAEKRRQEQLAEKAKAEKAEKDRQAQQPSPATS